MNSCRAYDSRRSGYHFNHLGHHSNSVRDLINQITSGIREAIIIERDTWTIVESFEAVTQDSLFHHDERYAKKCEPPIVVHVVSLEISM